MYVESFHNKAFAKALPSSILEQGRALANWHEYGVFSSPDLTGIGNSACVIRQLNTSSLTPPPVAGQTILPSILNSFASIVDPSDPLKIVYHATAYKPLLSLFNMTGVAEMNPELAGFGVSIPRYIIIYPYVPLHSQLCWCCCP